MSNPNDKDIGKVVMSSRVDLKDLATVARLLEDLGYPISSRSDLIRGAFEALTGPAKDPATSYKEAVAELKSHGITFQGNKKAEEDVFKALSAEELKESENKRSAKEEVQALDKMLSEKRKGGS